MQFPKIYNTYFVAMTATIGGALFGFDISSMSATIGTEQYTTYFNNPTSDQQGGITASMPGGSLVGAILAGFVCDRLGRKTTIQFSCILWIIGSILSCAAQNIAMLIVGRFINGLCVGFTSSQVPVYLAEISRHSVRGKIIVIQQLAIEVGILVMFYLGYGLSYVEGTASFRILWGLQMIPGVILFCMMPMLPESPRWLAGKDRWEECNEILGNVHAKGDKDDPLVLAEMLEIRQIVDLEKNYGGASYLALLNKRNWRRTIVGVMTQVWQQLAGGNVMMYYVVYVFQMAGLSGEVNLIASSVQYIIMLVFTFPAMFYVDKIGRRPLLLGGSVGMGAFVFAVGGLLATYGEPVDQVGDNPNIHITLEGQFGPSRGVLVCSYLFTMVYALSWAPVAWVYAPEVFPLYLRSKGMAVAAAGNWAMNFALAYYIPPAMDNIGYKTFIIFGVFCVVMFIHMFFMFPETAQKTLEEIDDLFGPDAQWAFRTRVGRSRIQQEEEEIRRGEKPATEIIEHATEDNSNKV
ncbi:hypothetical protein TRICI_001180 [Trichomonascus ciferrii]|uniref:Major facilitator superfamily (MFS) profile domain-containing protein n=1 Tax=Trichomonascus ciferrii TaxID=44093 RepID=A0A642VCR3_9ASCO|nr:hypothetical protein TRICI_001180 [Trichomonascus ciferrii]